MNRLEELAAALAGHPAVLQVPELRAVADELRAHLDRLEADRAEDAQQAESAAWLRRCAE